MPNAAPVEGTAERPRCPACRVELRMRDDKVVDPVFPCPECHVPLRLEHDNTGRCVIVLAEVPSVTKAAPPKKAGHRHKSVVAPATARPDRSLLLFSAGLGVVTLLIVGWLMWGRSTTATDAATSPVTESPVTVTEKTPPPVTEPHSWEHHLTQLAGQIQQHIDEHGSFPAAADATSPLPITQQFSWLARLEAHSESLPTERRPVLGKPWNDPVNEPFVGRRIPGYLNPSVSTMVGEDSRPATHFAGVAGVGRDAADLPAGHPRAGMFGTQRTIKIQDIRDGQANVVMVLGVEAQLGSWADPGRATVRPLTSPPYLHGLDGFGGGTRNELPALMADGSVRMFAPDTDPLLMRRLAAIADDLPLDLNTPGEPGDVTPTATPPVPSLAISDPDNPPVSALSALAEAQRPVIVRPPVAPLLQQRLTSFQQTKPVTRRQLLTIAEDLLGRPVVVDQEQLGPLTQQLDVTITFALENTTIAAVLEQVLHGTELELVIGPERAALQRRAAGATTAIRLEP